MKIQKVKDSIEAFFYKVRLNIAWHTALGGEEVAAFNKLIRSGIERQLLHFAKVEQVNRVIGVSKAVRELTDNLLLPEIDNLWIPLLAIIDEAEIQNYHLWAANTGGQIAIDKMGADQKFSLEKDNIIATIKAKASPLANQLDETTKNWVARTMQEGLRDGLSHVEIAELIRNTARKTAQARADLISENEATEMMGEMEMMVYKESGVKYTTWVTARDEMVCPLCMANEEAGKVATGEVFPSGAVAPPQHSHCRCFVKPFITSGEEVWDGR
ncbi:MAG: hypothetical protein KCHDKBKB_00770 [Elusimicrobia bacterium]|nr:hypothetical protein [Elusimicrobiota bacterium]